MIKFHSSGYRLLFEFVELVHWLPTWLFTFRTLILGQPVLKKYFILDSSVQLSNGHPWEFLLQRAPHLCREELEGGTATLSHRPPLAPDLLQCTRPCSGERLLWNFYQRKTVPLQKSLHQQLQEQCWNQLLVAADCWVLRKSLPRKMKRCTYFSRRPTKEFLMWTWHHWYVIIWRSTASVL